MQIRCLFMFLFCANMLNAQTKLSGLVTDTKDEPLAFVNILVNGDPHQGVSTDIDGLFRIQSDSPIQRLELSYVGYDNLVYPVVSSDTKLHLKMSSSSLELQEAVVVAGKNPAHRIIRATVANRDRNNPARLPSYSCETYNKMIFTFLPNKEALALERQKKSNEKSSKLKKRQNEVSDQYAGFETKHHIAVMETISKKDFLATNNHKETILLNRVSGLKNPQFAALAKDAQPFSFYEPDLPILTATYLNPISKGSTKAYFFDLRETLFQGQDTVFIIAYHPKKGTSFRGLEGVLYINSKHFAIQNVIARPTDISKTDIVIEQKYNYHPEADQWFPEQLNFEWAMPQYPMPNVGMRIIGKTYIQKVDLQAVLKRKNFSADIYVFDQKANERNDSLWQTYRPEQLSSKEQETYIWLDSIGDAAKLDEVFFLLQSLASGRVPLKVVDWHIWELVRGNEYEGWRPTLKLATNDSFSKWLRLRANVGYGWKDKAWKYGGDLRVRFHERTNLHLQMGYQKDVRLAGIPIPIESSVSLFDQRLYYQQMDDYEELYGKIGVRLFKNLDLEIQVSQSSWDPNYLYSYGEGDFLLAGTFDFTEATAAFRYAYNERFVPFMGTRLRRNTTYPIFTGSYTKGFNDWLGGAYDYQRFMFGVEQNVPLGRWGQLSYKIQASWINTEVPYAKLFVSNGIGTEIRLFDFSSTFQTMQPLEFLSNQVVHFFLEHDFGMLTKGNKYSRPELSIMHNLAYGKLEDGRLNHFVPYRTLEHGFFESGIALDNLIRINYFNVAYIGLGWATYYRYGAYTFDKINDNFAHRLTVDFTF